MKRMLPILFALIVVPNLVDAHPGTLDAYGCHSNTARYGKSATRECHNGLLADSTPNVYPEPIFASLQAELKNYIAAQGNLILMLQSQLSVEQTARALAENQIAILTAEIARLNALLQPPPLPPPQPLTYNAALTWNANQEPDLAGYKLYMGTASGIYGPPIDLGNITAHTVQNLSQGTRRYFAITAYDMSGNESAFSNEVSK